MVCYYKNDKINGLYKEYYDDYKIKKECCYKDDIMIVKVTN